MPAESAQNSASQADPQCSAAAGKASLQQSAGKEQEPGNQATLKIVSNQLHNDSHGSFHGGGKQVIVSPSLMSMQVTGTL